MKYIQKDDIQSKVELSHIGGFDWHRFPNVDLDQFFEIENEPEKMNKIYWAWKTAILLSENDLDALYRPSIDSDYLIGEFTIDMGYSQHGIVVVSLSNIDWDSISGNDPIGFFDIDLNDKVEYDLEERRVDY